VTFSLVDYSSDVPQFNLALPDISGCHIHTISEIPETEDLPPLKRKNKKKVEFSEKSEKPKKVEFYSAEKPKKVGFSEKVDFSFEKQTEVGFSDFEEVSLKITKVILQKNQQTIIT